MAWFPDRNIREFSFRNVRFKQYTLYSDVLHILQLKSKYSQSFCSAQKKLQLFNGNFTANNKWNSAFILLVYSTFTPSQLSEYLYVTYLKFISWSCLYLRPSFVLRKYSTRTHYGHLAALSCSISSYLHRCASLALSASASFLPFSLYAQILHILKFLSRSCILVTCFTNSFLQLSCSTASSYIN